MRVQGFGRLMASALLSRTSLAMSTVAFVLFTLQRFHSPGIAGLAIFLLIFPGLLMSPINGALLDRFGRMRLMALDYTVAASGVLLIAALAFTDSLAAWSLLLIVSIVSLTSTLSAAGSRALVPQLVPPALWERANAVDTLAYGVSTVAGPAIAGGVTALAGGATALVCVAAGYLAAAATLVMVREPDREPPGDAGVMRAAWQGLRYVISHRSLRWLAVTMSLSNIGFGIIVVAVPVLVLHEHGNAALAGAVFAVEGAVGIPAALWAGRMRTDRRERAIIFACYLGVAAATSLLLVPNLAVPFAMAAFIGLLDAPTNIALFSLRQRRTERSWFGRAFAVSMSLNYAGMPLGSALAGPLIGFSLPLTIIVAAACAAGSAAVVWRIPR
jgi:MFS family permease